MNYYEQELSDQDKHIDELNEVAGRIKQNTDKLTAGLNDQGQLINDLESGIDQNQEKMNVVQKKLAVLLQTNDSSQICTVLILFGILCVLVFLVFYT